MREINILARALAGEFGSAQRLADEVRLLVRRAPLSAETSGVYLPPAGRRLLPALVIGDRERREELIVAALAHHFLRHRELSLYAYGPDGPLYDAPRAAAEVSEFSETFRSLCRPMTITRRDAR